jgi:hypothetical protein
MKIRPFRFSLGFGAGLLLAALLLAAFVWLAVLPPADSRGPRYVLWKLGLAQFDEHVVYLAMVQDTDRDSLVLGLSELELTKRFVTVRSPQRGLSSEQAYYTKTYFPSSEVRWLGESQWMVVLREGRVASLHIMKGG